MKAQEKKIAKFKETARVWANLSPPLAPIRNEKQYRRAVDFLDYLIDEVREDEDHRLAPLMEIIGVLVEKYEAEMLPELKSSGKEVLKMLMEEHGIVQKDLRKDLGSQGVVSEILHGKRKLNVRQIKALSERFGVPPAVFLEEEVS